MIFSITTLGITALGITTLSITALGNVFMRGILAITGIMTLCITTLGIMGLFATLYINDTQLSSIECHYAVSRCNVECHFAECHFVECHYAEYVGDNWKQKVLFQVCL